MAATDFRQIQRGDSDRTTMFRRQDVFEDQLLGRNKKQGRHTFFCSS